MDRMTQTEATESRKNSPDQKMLKDKTGTEFFSGGNESFLPPKRVKRKFGERRKKNIDKVSACSGCIRDEEGVAGQTPIQPLQDPEWLFCPVPGCGFWTRKPDRMSRHKICHVDEVKQTYRCPGNCLEPKEFLTYCTIVMVHRPIVKICYCSRHHVGFAEFLKC